MKKFQILILSLSILACSTKTIEDNAIIQNSSQSYLDAAIDENNPGVLLHIESPEEILG